MKKLVTCLAALACLCLLAAPASAVHLTDEDKGELKSMIAESWDFYGHARMDTFWVSTDDEYDATVSDDYIVLDHDVESVSRFGATVDHGKIGGRVEIEANAAHSGGASVNTRRLYGTLDLGPGQLKVGQDWTPFTLANFYSGQTYPDSNVMLGYVGYDHRYPQLTYSVENFTISLVRPHGSFEGGPSSLEGNSTTAIPMFQASYNVDMGGVKLYTAGILQSYTLAEGNDPGEGDTLTSYAITANFRLGGVLPGNLYSNFGGYYGQNVGNMGMLVGGTSFKLSGTASAAVDNTTGDVNEDATTAAGLLCVGTKVNNIGVEAGFGYAQNDRDDYSDADAEMTYYLNANIPLVEDHSAFIVPEVGMTDAMDDTSGNDQGTETFFGMKTEIRF